MDYIILKINVEHLIVPQSFLGGDEKVPQPGESEKVPIISEG